MSYEVKKILVPVDLSEASLNALETAIAIAKTKHARLHIMNVDDTSLEFYSENEHFKSAGNAGNILAALANSISKTHELKPELILEKGNVGDAILNGADHQECDLIVMGTHGASGYRDSFIGSTSYYVVKCSNRPVLLIPPTRKVTAFRKIAFPVRPVAGALSSYGILCHFLSGGSKLEIVGLAYKAQEKTKLLDSLLKDISEKLEADNITAHTNWAFGNSIVENILNTATELKADLLVITSSIDVTTKPFFIGPHTQTIINWSRIPLLCIKRPGHGSFA